MRLVVTPTSPRHPTPARGTAIAALTNTVGWFTIAVGLWAGVGGAVPLWVGAAISLAAVPAAAWNGPERAAAPAGEPTGAPRQSTARPTTASVDASPAGNRRKDGRHLSPAGGGSSRQG